MTTQPLLDFDAPPPAQVQSEMRRELGVTRAIAAARRHVPGWEDDALAAVRRFAETHESFLSEEVRETCPTPDEVDPRAWGGVLRRAAVQGIVQRDGFGLANSSNRSPKVKWKSLVYTGRN